MLTWPGRGVWAPTVPGVQALRIRKQDHQLEGLGALQPATVHLWIESI